MKKPHHYSKDVKVRPFTSCVAKDCDPRSHGGITEIAVCSCGAVCYTNRNQVWAESSGWISWDETINRSYKENPIKDNPIKENPMKDNQMKENPMRETGYTEAEITNGLEQPKTNTIRLREGRSS